MAHTANQNVKKLDANNYTTSMIGLKYKLAYKGADSNNRSSSDHARKKRLIVILSRVDRTVKKRND